MFELLDKLVFQLCEKLRYSTVTIFSLVLAVVVIASAFLLRYDKRRRTAWAVMFGLGMSILLVSCFLLSDSILRWSGFIGWPPSQRRLLQKLIGP
jgi:hypothetical protein